MKNTGWKRKFFIFMHKKYPYDFKIEIIGVQLLQRKRLVLGWILSTPFVLYNCS